MAALQSLGDAIDNFTDHKPDANENETQAWRRRTKAWLLVLPGESSQKTAFESTLAPAQLVTHRALSEWVGRTEREDEEFNTAAKRALIASINEDLQPPVSYHKVMGHLHTCEFFVPRHFRDFGLDRFRAYLHTLRQHALRLASSQRMAQCYLRSLEKSLRQAGHLASLHTLRQHALRLASNLRIPQRYLRPLGKSLLQTAQAPSGITPYLDSCSWLDLPGRDKGMPHYLWDVKLKRTRVVQEMGFIPDYVAVSHTWGRMKMVPEQWYLFPADSVPWEIPKNKKFPVEKLPEMLEILPFDFVWLDLLTVPQGKTNAALLKLQHQEISRQAQIYRNASQAIIWLNDITTWEGVQASLHWLCLAFLKQEGRKEITPSHTVASLLDNQLKTATVNELFEGKLNPWFTSLWTLQEICLRPDMLICNREWEPLTIANTTCVSLAEISALVATAHFTIQGPEGPIAPVAVQILGGVLADTGLVHLLHLSPKFLLWLSTRRECSGERAEAIMSAIGATEWFQTEERKQNLILDSYPLVFLQEVRRKLGSGIFFDFGIVGGGIEAEWLLKMCQIPSDAGKLGKDDAVGTLLPIGLGADATMSDPNALSDYMEHPAVKSWIIEESGSIRIKEAGILTPETIAHYREEDWIVDGPSEETGWSGIST